MIVAVVVSLTAVTAVVALVTRRVMVGAARGATLRAVGRGLVSLLDDFHLWGQWSPYALCGKTAPPLSIAPRPLRCPDETRI